MVVAPNGPSAVEGSPTDAADSEALAEALEYVSTLSALAAPIPRDFLEAARIEAGCLGHMGFKLADPDSAHQYGVNVYEVPPSQRRAFEDSSTACENALTAAGFVTPGGEVAQSQRYRAWVVVYNCLLSEGYPVIPVPSEPTFLENPGSWHPYAAMIEIGTTIIPFGPIRGSDRYRQYFEALEVCPMP